MLSKGSGAVRRIPKCTLIHTYHADIWRLWGELGKPAPLSLMKGLSWLPLSPQEEGACFFHAQASPPQRLGAELSRSECAHQEAMRIHQ